jgi:hypothetical protein
MVLNQQSIEIKQQAYKFLKSLVLLQRKQQNTSDEQEGIYRY